MVNSFAAQRLKKEGMAVMFSTLLYDVCFDKKESLEAAEHFKKFLLQLDQMLDDDMIFEIKDVICDVLP